MLDDSGWRIMGAGSGFAAVINSCAGAMNSRQFSAAFSKINLFAA